MSFFKKNFEISTEGKDFYKSLFNVVGPIAVQNLISAAVSSTDVIMLSFVGQTAIAAASLAGNGEKKTLNQSEFCMELH